MKGQSKSSVSTHDVKPEKDEKLLDLLDIKWEEPAEGSEGDLRRLACRLCGHQTNGRRFFAMVEHLEGTHDMFQESRFYSLDKYVMFRCAKCELFEPSDVHTWATHFHKSDSTQCAATMPSTSKAAVTATTAAEAEMERKRRAEEKEADALEKKEDEINPKDIRTMQCKICHTFVDKCRFLPMQVSSIDIYFSFSCHIY